MDMCLKSIVLIYLMTITYNGCTEQKLNGAQNYCSHEYSESTGVLVSPGYPKKYDNNKDCRWRIRTTPGDVITIIFHDFKLQQKYKAGYCEDYVTIHDEITSKDILHKICENRATPFYWRSYCHDIVVIFHSDRGGVEKGFNITWKAEKEVNNTHACFKKTTTNKATKSPTSPKTTSRITNVTTSQETTTPPTSARSSMGSSTRSSQEPTTKSSTTKLTSSTAATVQTSTAIIAQSSEDTTVHISSDNSTDMQSTTKAKLKETKKTALYAALAGIGFLNVLAVVAVCYALKGRCKSRLSRLKGEEEEENNSEANGFWKRPKSVISGFRQSMYPSKTENVYAEVNDTILGKKRQPIKPSMNNDLARIIKETTISANKTNLTVNDNKDISGRKKDASQQKFHVNVNNTAMPTGNNTMSASSTVTNHVYAEIDDEICNLSDKAKEGTQKYELAKPMLNESSTNDAYFTVEKRDEFKNKDKKHDLVKPLSNETETAANNYFILENAKHANSNDYFVLEKGNTSVSPASVLQEERNYNPNSDTFAYDVAGAIYQSPTLQRTSDKQTKRESTCPYDVSENLAGEYDEIKHATSKTRRSLFQTAKNYGFWGITKLFSVKGEQGPYSLAKT